MGRPAWRSILALIVVVIAVIAIIDIEHRYGETGGLWATYIGCGLGFASLVPFILSLLPWLRALAPNHAARLATARELASQIALPRLRWLDKGRVADASNTITIPCQVEALAAGQRALALETVKTARDLAGYLSARIDRPTIVLGPAGSGKSTLADLTLAAWDDRNGVSPSIDSPVPFRINLASWEPSRANLLDWAARQVRQVCRDLNLQVPQLSQRMVKGLIEHGFLLLLLDGLDEIPSTLFPADRSPVSLICDAMQRNFVLLTQPQALSASDIDLLHRRCDVISLLPLAPSEAAQLLIRDRSQGGPSSWDDIASRLQANEPADPLVGVLQVPLYASIARQLKYAAAPVPAPLLSGDSTREDIEEGLLTASLDRFYGATGRKLRQSKRWLQTAAAVMDTSSSRSLFVWWSLGNLIPWYVEVVATACLVFAVTFLWEAVTHVRWGATSAAVFTAMIVAGVRGPLPHRPSHFHPFSRRVALTAFASALILGNHFGQSAPGVLPWTDIGVANWLYSAVVFGAFVWGALAIVRKTFSPAYIGRLPRVPRIIGWRPTYRKTIVSLLLGLLFATAFTFADAGILAAPTNVAVNSTSRSVDYQYDGRDAVDWHALSWRTVGEGVVVLLITTIIVSLAASLACPIDANPRDNLPAGLGRNACFGLLSFFAWTGLVVSFVALSVSSFPVDLPELASRHLTHVEQIAFVFGVTWIAISTVCCSLGILLSAAGRYYVAALLLWVTHAWPLRPKVAFGFLRVAHEHGLLRQYGQGYAFVHERMKQAVLDDRPGHTGS